MSTLVCYRDKIEWNDEFQSWLERRIESSNETEDPVDSICLAARDLTIAGRFTFQGVALEIAAETLSGSQGQITLLYEHSKRPFIKAFFKSLDGIAIQSLGEPGHWGSPGKDGEPGTPGKDGKPGSPDGGNGGNGGWGLDGGNGGNGGDGGDIYFGYCLATGPISISSQGGAAGLGGRRGKAGRGGRGGIGWPPNGKNGKPGRDGEAGFPGEDGLPGRNGFVSGGQVSEEGFWANAGNITGTPGSGSDSWAGYRVRMGKYHFRAGRLVEASQEFDAALRLDPSNADAALYKERLLSNQNILGFPRDFDIIPDFEYWEKTVVGYREPILAIFQITIDMLQEVFDIDRAKQHLAAQINFNEANLLKVLPEEKAAANLELAAAAAQKKHSQERLDNIDKEIKSCQENSFSLGDMISTIVKVGSAVVGLVGGVVTGVAGYVWIATNLTDSYLATLFKDDKDGKDARKELKEKAGGIKDLVDGVGEAISVFKVIEDISNAESDKPECLALLKQKAEIVHELLMATFREKQADHLLRASEAKVDIAAAYNDSLITLQEDLENDIKQIKQVIRVLLFFLDAYTDIYLKYVFYEARALQIYTLNQDVPMKYDYVSFNPDLIENFMEGYGEDPNEADHHKQMRGIIEEMQGTWKLFVDTFQYRNDYDAYIQSGNLVHDIYSTHLTIGADDTSIEKFKNTYELQFTVNFSDLWKTHYDCKVESVELVLSGAKSNSAIVRTISCVVEHSGICHFRDAYDETISMTLCPRPAIVVVEEYQPNQYRGKTIGTEPMDLMFWGRSIVTTWRLFIPQEEIDMHQVDLSELSQIQILIGYKAFQRQWRFFPIIIEWLNERIRWMYSLIKFLTGLLVRD